MKRWTGKQIYALRTTMGLSREYFAQLVGVTANTVYRWEKKGISPRSMAIIRRLEELELKIKKEEAENK